MGRDKVLNIVLVVVTFVWALSFAADVAVPSYQPPPEIHSIFMAIVGGVFVAGSGSRDNSSTPSENNELPIDRNRQPETPEEETR